jgi:membrane protein
MQGTFRIIFPAQTKRSFVVSWILPLVILPLLFALMGVAALAQVILDFLEQYEFIGTGNAHVLQALNSLFGFAMVWALLFAAYWRLPRQHPRARHAAVFALAATLGLGLLLALSAPSSSWRTTSLYARWWRGVRADRGYFAFLLLYLWAQALYATARPTSTRWKAVRRQRRRRQQARGLRLGDAGARWKRPVPAGHTLIEEGDDSHRLLSLRRPRPVYKNTGDGRRRLGNSTRASCSARWPTC